MKKPAVRALARKLKLPNAEKRESMGLCFVGKIRLKDFLEQKLKPKPGQIVLVPSVSSRNFLRIGTSSAAKNIRDPEISILLDPGSRMHSAGMTGGVVIGQHQGLYNYTIGQRQGINVGGGGPYYVVKKDLKSNTLFVTHDAKDKALMVKEVQLHSLNWIAHVEARRGVPLQGRYRHQGQLVNVSHQ